MSALIPFLIFCQALGAFTGAFSAVWSEIAYVRAMHDGKIDHAERAHLDSIARGLRFGMTLLLLASFGLVIADFALRAALQPALTPSYWIFIVLALVIIGVSWALSRHFISFAFGSALIFTAWWFLAYLSIGWLPPLTFGAALAFFAVATAIFYVILQANRFFVLRKK